MIKLGKPIILFLTLVVVSALVVTSSPGQIAPCCQVEVQSDGGTILSCPQGDGKTLAQVGATIEVTVLDPVTGNPVEGVPATDFWLIDCDPANTLVLCGGSQSSAADGPTDENGYTTISGTIAAGGYVDGLALVVQGCVVDDPATDCTTPKCLPINVRSVDINGDLVVDQADLDLVLSAYPPNPYQSFADFDGSGQVSLIDLTLFAAHYGPPGHECATGELYTISGQCQNVYSKDGVANLYVTFDEYSDTSDADGRFMFLDVPLDSDSVAVVIETGSADVDTSDPEKGPYHTITQTFDVNELVEADFYMIPEEATETCWPTLLSMLVDLYSMHYNNPFGDILRPWESLQFPIDVYIAPNVPDIMRDQIKAACRDWNDAITGTGEFEPDSVFEYESAVDTLQCDGINVFLNPWGGPPLAAAINNAYDDLGHPIRGRIRFFESVADSSVCRSVARHELGHILTWKHPTSQYCQSVMKNYGAQLILNDDRRLFLLMNQYLPDGLDLSVYDVFANYDHRALPGDCDEQAPHESN